MLAGPASDYFKTGAIQEGNKDSAGELSATLVDAQKLLLMSFLDLSGKTKPSIVLMLGDQAICSKMNSRTTIIGPLGDPIWNQDFHLLVANPRKQRLSIQVKDSFGFTDFTIGTGEVELGFLQDTVPTDSIINSQGGWGLFRKRSTREVLLHLTYKAYVEDEEDDGTQAEALDIDLSDDEDSDSDEANGTYEQNERDLSEETENLLWIY